MISVNPKVWCAGEPTVPLRVWRCDSWADHPNHVRIGARTSRAGVLRTLPSQIRILTTAVGKPAWVSILQLFRLLERGSRFVRALDSLTIKGSSRSEVIEFAVRHPRRLSEVFFEGGPR